ncbi:hypothetical protein BKI52_20075 [marine bacterium AO1-C]|nr:hypothetical protein BKI52_20075 [marine bacterium AO1-C]
MKNIFVFATALLISIIQTQAQITITPTKKFIENQYLQNEVSRYELSVEVNGKRVVRAVQEDAITLMPAKNQLLRVQKLLVQGRAMSIDSALITLDNFQPIYHAGINPRRNIQLKYDYATGKIMGSYTPKKQAKPQAIDQKVLTPYFDSNVYEMMLRFLPLKPSLKAKFPAYAYESEEKNGVRWYQIQEVTLQKFNDQPCFVVKVKNKQGQVIHYWINQQNRTLHKYEIQLPNGRKVLFTKV